MDLPVSVPLALGLPPHPAATAAATTTSSSSLSSSSYLLSLFYLLPPYMGLGLRSGPCVSKASALPTKLSASPEYVVYRADQNGKTIQGRSGQAMGCFIARKETEAEYYQVQQRPGLVTLVELAPPTP